MVGIAVLTLTLLTPAARAMTKQEVGANAAFQVALCKAGGGTAVVVDSPGFTIVHCYGGVYHGMDCYNDPEGTFCTGAHPHPVPFAPGTLWPLEQVIPVLETGSPEEMHQILTDLQTTNNQEPGTGPVAASPDDRHQAQNAPKTKHKKSKHGKKGGKRHK